jgi:hypothetical protein
MVTRGNTTKSLYAAEVLHSVASTALQEDQKLIELVERQKKVPQNISFDRIAAEFPDRDKTQCRNRYYGYLDPTLDHSPFRGEEIRAILWVVPSKLFLFFSDLLLPSPPVAPTAVGEV